MTEHELIETSEVGPTVEVAGGKIEVEADEEYTDIEHLRNFVYDEDDEGLDDDAVAALFSAILKVDALERGSDGWKFTEPERTALGKAQSVARLAGL